MQTVREGQAAVVRDRVLDAVSVLVEAGDDITFAKVAASAGVPERTIYRYFPNREALIAALFDYTNRRIGFDGELPTTPDAMTAMVQRVFPGFDTVAPIISELLMSPGGRRARLASLADRQAAAQAVVAAARPDLDARTAHDLAAVVQALGTASTWQTLRDFWAMDGNEAAAAVTTAIDILLTAPNAPTGGT